MTRTQYNNIGNLIISLQLLLSLYRQPASISKCVCVVNPPLQVSSSHFTSKVNYSFGRHCCFDIFSRVAGEESHSLLVHSNNHVILDHQH